MIDFAVFIIAGNRDISAVLNNRALMMMIADLLERNGGNDLENLALSFDVTDPSQLTSVEPSRRFFTHLANNRLDINLADLKRLIESDLRVTRATIFPPIKKDIEAGNVDFTLESNLADMKGRNWLYLLKNVADKLLENTSQLPSWKDIADYYRYSHDTIESFSINLTNVRPTVKLFQYLSFMESIPTMAMLKRHLQDIDRIDIVKEIDKRFARNSL